MIAKYPTARSMSFADIMWQAKGVLEYWSRGSSELMLFSVSEYDARGRENRKNDWNTLSECKLLVMFAGWVQCLESRVQI